MNRDELVIGTVIQCPFRHDKMELKLPYIDRNRHFGIFLESGMQCILCITHQDRNLLKKLIIIMNKLPPSDKLGILKLDLGQGLKKITNIMANKLF